MRELAGGKAARGAATVVAVCALAFGLNACGDDDDEESGDSAAVEETTTTEEASAEEVTVTATEYDFELSAQPTAETKSVTFDNQGKEFHVMIYARLGEGYTLEEALEMEGEKGSAITLAEAEAAPGKSVDIPIKETAEPGSYVMLCPIEDKAGAHYELGQLEEFELE